MFSVSASADTGADTNAVGDSTAAADPGDWQFEASAYLWGASIGGDTATGGEIDISFTDIINNLDMALMGHLNATKDKWKLSADVIYLDVSATNGDDRLTARPGLSASSESKLSMKAWILTPGVNYEVLGDDQWTLYGMAGARFLSLDIGVKTDTESVLGGRTVKTSDSGSVWDGIVGLNGRINLSDNWTLQYYGDIGTGQSDLTWQAYAGVAYRFKYVDAVLGYRYLKWNFDETASLDNLELKGPLAGVTYRF